MIAALSLKLIVPLLFLIAMTFGKEKRAIATLFLNHRYSSMPGTYIGLLQNFVESLRFSGYSDEILVYVSDDKDINLIMKLGGAITLKKVPEIIINKVNDERYKKVLTKLHMWDMTDYDQIMYFDLDFIFLKNPESAFDLCGSAELCATPDMQIHHVDGYRSLSPGSYFNSGFMVIRPNRVVFQMLMTNRQFAENKVFADQDYLNHAFRGKWKKLPRVYNIMHIQRHDLNANAVAIHEKTWILKQMFPFPKHAIWQFQEK